MKAPDERVLPTLGSALDHRRLVRAEQNEMRDRQLLVPRAELAQRQRNRQAGTARREAEATRLTAGIQSLIAQAAGYLTSEQIPHDFVVQTRKSRKDPKQVNNLQEDGVGAWAICPPHEHPIPKGLDYSIIRGHGIVIHSLGEACRISYPGRWNGKPMTVGGVKISCAGLLYGPDILDKPYPQPRPQSVDETNIAYNKWECAIVAMIESRGVL